MVLDMKDDNAYPDEPDIHFNVAETLLRKLIIQKDEVVDIEDIEHRIDEFCQEAERNLDICTFETKRLALDILNIQVVATPKTIEVKVSVPLDFITTEQTSGCMSSHAYNWMIPFSLAINA